MEYAASISPRVAMRYWWRRFALCVLMLPAWAVCTPALAVAAGAAALHLPASWDGKLPGADGTLHWHLDLLPEPDTRNVAHTGGRST